MGNMKPAGPSFAGSIVQPMKCIRTLKNMSRPTRRQMSRVGWKLTVTGTGVRIVLSGCTALPGLIEAIQLTGRTGCPGWLAGLVSGRSSPVSASTACTTQKMGVPCGGSGPPPRGSYQAVNNTSFAGTVNPPMVGVSPCDAGLPGSELVQRTSPRSSSLGGGGAVVDDNAGGNVTGG